MKKYIQFLWVNPSMALLCLLYFIVIIGYFIQLTEDPRRELERQATRDAVRSHIYSKTYNQVKQSLEHSP